MDDPRLQLFGRSGAAFTDPAWHASVGDILRKREVPAAVTLISVGYNAVRSIGPALGGIVVASSGPLTAFALATLTYLALWTIGRRKWSVGSSPLPREPLTTAIHDGARFTAMSAEIKAAIARGALFGLASISILALLPLVARDHLGGGPIAYGILMAGFGAGALCAGICNNVLRRSVSRATDNACMRCLRGVFAFSCSHLFAGSGGYALRSAARAGSSPGPGST